jgi:hypothetical protein
LLYEYSMFCISYWKLNSTLWSSYCFETSSFDIDLLFSGHFDVEFFLGSQDNCKKKFYNNTKMQRPSTNPFISPQPARELHAITKEQQKTFQHMTYFQSTQLLCPTGPFQPQQPHQIPPVN